MTATTAPMQALGEMATTDLANLIRDLDSAIREQGRLIRTTPRDTTAYAAMVESRPGLLKFRAAVDDELDRRGA